MPNEKVQFLLGYFPLFLAAIAAVMGTGGTLYCQTISFSQVDNENGNRLFAGVYGYRTRGYVQSGDDTLWVVTFCQSYNVLPDDLGFPFETDSKTKAVQVLALIAPILGLFFLVAACLAPCVKRLRAGWKAYGVVFLVAGICQGCTLLILESSLCLNNPVLQFLQAEYPDVREGLVDTCEADAGYNMAIAATAFWILAGVMTLVVSVPVDEDYTRAVTGRGEEEGNHQVHVGGLELEGDGPRMPTNTEASTT